jgi:hypothetical protein
MTPDEVFAEVLEFAQAQAADLGRRLPALLASAREIGREEGREECARLADGYAEAGLAPMAARVIARAIRARGGP